MFVDESTTVTAWVEPAEHISDPWGAAREVAVAVELAFTEVDDESDALKVLDAAWRDLEELVPDGYFPLWILDEILDRVDGPWARLEAYREMHSGFGSPFVRELYEDEARFTYRSDLVDAWHGLVHAAARFPWPAAPWQQAI